MGGGWVSPLPARLASKVTMHAPGADVRAIASRICDKAWRGLGVHVFIWPCGAWAIASVGSHDDALLMRECGAHYFATYAKGALFRHVLDDLRWARARRT